METETADEVVDAEARLRRTGIETTGVDDTSCCHATRTETWVESPDGARWEWYVRTGDSEVLQNQPAGAAPTPAASDVTRGVTRGV